MPVFISYSSKDRSIAETICQALESRGQSCWIACRDVKGGENFQEAIVKALRQARVMLLVFSSNANNSDEIKKELVLAGRHRVTVIPVRVEDVVPNDAFEYEFATRQWFDLFRDWEKEIEYLSLQIGKILESAPPEKNAGADNTAIPFSPKKSNHLTAIGIAALILLLIGGALAYWQPWRAPVTARMAATASIEPQSAQPGTPAAPVQAAAQAPASVAPATAQAPAPKPAHAPARQRQVASLAPPPPSSVPASAPPAIAPPVPVPTGAPPAAAAAGTDDGAWQVASNANTRGSFTDYVKAFPAGLHAQEAQMRIATLILNMPATGSAFDGSWQTTWTCPNLGSYLGYSYQFEGRVKDGVYHGVKGEQGQPSSMVLDGKIESDGAAAFNGEVIVGSSMTGLGAARGTPSDFHADAIFNGGSGQGRRLEGRPCSLSFARQ